MQLLRGVAEAHPEAREVGVDDAIEFGAVSIHVASAERAKPSQVRLDLALRATCVAACGLGHEEPPGDDRAQHLVGQGIDEWIACRRTRDARIDSGPRKCLQRALALFPVHRHQGEDEIRLIELDALGVGPDEDFRDLLLIRLRGEHDDLEEEVCQIMHPVDAFAERVLLQFGEGSLARPAEPVQPVPFL
ncbi:MAG: hypothetical protein Q8P38_10585 [Candidatus Nanopelagicales bacterium]|nr:hypothetical protein [Candidatus Nanopelagicales bacterium]